MKILKKLDEWVNLDLISLEQKEKISNYELAKPDGYNRLLFGFLFIAAFAIGIGLISLIAYNWVHLGKYTKVFGGMIVLITFLYAHIKMNEKGLKGLGELFLTIFYLGCLGYIGLIAQIYNLSDEPHRGFVLWGIITSPLLFLTRRAYLPFIWFFNFFACVFIELGNFELFQNLVKTISDNINPPIVFIAAILFQFILWRGGKILFRKSKPIRRAFSTYMIMAMISTVWNMDALSNFDFSWLMKNETNYTIYFSFVLISILMAIGAWFLTPKKEPAFLKSLLIMIYVFYVVNLIPGLSPYWFAIFNILIMAMLAGFGALNDRKWIFNLFMTFIIIRIIIIYLTAFDGLLETGLWLIGTGIVITGAIIIWNKYKIYLERMVKEYLQ